MTLALVPTQCRSSGEGSSTSGLLCRSTPSGRSRRTASCAAARERSRPTVIGNTAPGNITTFRTGRMISASSGSGRDAVSPTAGSCAVIVPFGVRPSADNGVGFVCVSSFMRWSARAPQVQDQAALREFGYAGVEPASGKRDATLEGAVRDFEVAHGQRTAGEGQRPLAAYDQCAVLGDDLDAVGGNAGHRHDDDHFALVLEHV